MSKVSEDMFSKYPYNQVDISYPLAQWTPPWEYLAKNSKKEIYEILMNAWVIDDAIKENKNNEIYSWDWPY
jgi:hypothetical protein